MQAIASQIGYSETAFLARVGERKYRVRYFSPLAEVAFCGHATIAAAVALAACEGVGEFDFETNGGHVAVEAARAEGSVTATRDLAPPARRGAADEPR